MPDKRPALRRRIAPSVPLEISFSDENGNFKKTYRLAFNLNVLAEISEKTGRSALDVSVWAKLDARVIRAMLWAALLPFQPEFDTRDAKTGERTNDGLETVGSWLAGENQDRSVDALWDAYLAYLPANEAEAMRESLKKANEALRSEALTKSPTEDDASGGEVPLDQKAKSPTAGSICGPLPATTSESPIAKSAS